MAHRRNAIMGMRGGGIRGEMAARGALWEKQEAGRVGRASVDKQTRDAALKRAEALRGASQYQTEASMRMMERQRQNQETARQTTVAAEERARADLNPWRQSGLDALGKLTAKIDEGPGEFTESPGYQFRLKEGQKAVERSAAARGGALSGAAVKAGLRYGQDFATNDYDNFLRRYYDSMKPLERMSGEGRDTSARMGQISTESAERQAQQGRYANTSMDTAERYGADAQYRGAEQSSDVMFQQEQGKAERDYAYAAFKAGEDF